MLTEEFKLSHIRARQLSAVDHFLPSMMIANIVCAGGLTYLLLGENSALVIGWLCLVTLMSGSRLIQALRSGPDQPRASQRALRRSVVQSAVMALCFTSIPAWFLTRTTGMTFTILVCQLTGTIWAGSLVLATIPQAAIVFVVIAGSMIVAGLLFSGISVGSVFLAMLFSAGSVTAIFSALMQSRLFIASQRQQYDLKQQGDVIQLLLKDYEEQTSDWLWETDEDLRLRNPSPRFSIALGRAPSGIADSFLETLLLDRDAPGNEEARAKLRDYAASRAPFRDLIFPFGVNGLTHWLSLSGRPLCDEQGTFLGYRGVASDVTAAKRAEAKLAYLAHHDSLTGLPNRSFFQDSLDQALLARGNQKLAVVSFDLDGFKAVNDRYGHPAADALLVSVAQRVRGLVQGGDIVARFGGDEFVILDVQGDPAGVERLCARVIEHLNMPFTILDEQVTVGVSIGVALAPVDGTTSDDLIKNADAALYRAKAEGRGAFRFFSPEMDRRLQERRLLIQDLRSALSRDELILFFQPFVSAETGAVSGCETLLRWRHPERGMVSPAEFIPLAEESGLILPIGAWIIEAACREATRWPSHLCVSVNISPVQFRNRDLPETILKALITTRLAPSRLEVEVTETVLIEDANAALDILRRIRALGVRVALDDFGTGYSSLSYLRRFPFDKLKIDRSFVQQLDTRRDSQIIVQAIRDIAYGLNMTITAEGVETPEQAEQLRATGCEELQGFLYSEPKPANELRLDQAGYGAARRDAEHHPEARVILADEGTA